MGALFVFSLGLLYGNFVEWFVHKYLFHGLGKKYKSVFAFHLREHHIKSRKDNFLDSAVTTRENLGIIGLLLTHLPIYFFVSPLSKINYIYFWSINIIKYNEIFI